MALLGYIFSNLDWSLLLLSSLSSKLSQVIQLIEICSLLQVFTCSSHSQLFLTIFLRFLFPFTLDLNECQTSSHGCSNHARCSNTIGSYTCQCQNGFTGNGTTCSNVNECTSGNYSCKVNAKCKDTVGSYVCVCKNGFWGNGTGGEGCANMNECTLGQHNCHSNADCVDTIGSYLCQCRKGYTGTGTSCVNINECQSRTYNCQANLVCVDNAGSFECTCLNGYTKTGNQCSDIHECTAGTHNCHQQALCTNTRGSFLCQCNGGLTGNGTACANSGRLRYLHIHKGGHYPKHSIRSTVKKLLFPLKRPFLNGFSYQVWERNTNLTMRKFTFCGHFYASFQAEDETVPHPISVFFFFLRLAPTFLHCMLP